MSIADEISQLSEAIDAAGPIPNNSLNNLDAMILVLEDRRYFCHPGFDIFSILRATIVTCLRGKGGGASTIEQQLVRTITGYRERTIARKIKEIRLALKVSQRYSKMEILHVYERLAYFGEGIQGIEGAARRLFEKSTTELDISEAAKVASCLVNPIPSKPTAHWEARIFRRGNYALNMSQHLVKGIACFGYRVGVGKRRPHLVSDQLARSLDRIRVSSPQ